MLINFNQTKAVTLPGMNDGTGLMSAQMYVDKQRKIIPCKIHVDGSIGTHPHETSEDINYVLSGVGYAICDGVKEELSAGVCHVCLKGSAHSIVNTGSEDLVILTVVIER